VRLLAVVFAGSRYLLLIDALMNWHQWVEFAHRNAGIASFSLLVLGSVLGSIYAHKVFRALKFEVKAFQGLMTEVCKELTAIKGAVDHASQSTEESIADLRASIDRLDKHQEPGPQKLCDEAKSAKPKNDAAVVTQLGEELETPNFPSSVADYLRYVQEKRLAATEAKSDFLHDGNLVPSPAGKFIVVSDEHSADDLAVPQIARFSSSEDFSGYFGDYFECEAPAAGEVWITRPARVRNDEIKGGWHVIKKGALEVRQ
jgi:hypothetical protein